MQPRILLIDDSDEVRRAVETALGRAHQIACAPSIAAADTLLAKSEYDLILLDIELPDGDGFRYCATLRNDPRTKEVPIIFLTARSEVSDKVLGFSLGAEDYVPKPFHVAELRARVEARLRKIQDQDSGKTKVEKGDFRFNLSTLRAWVVSASMEIELELTPLEFRLLLYFAQHDDHELSRDRLINAVWGENVHIVDRNVDTQVSALRKKIAASTYTIKAVHGEGYRFSAAKSKA